MGVNSDITLGQPLHLDPMLGRMANRDDSIESRSRIDTPSYSFSEFGEALLEGSLLSDGSLQYMLKNLTWECNCCFNPEAPIVELATNPANTLKCTDPSLQSPIGSRFRGPVTPCPNVQLRLLNYKKCTRRASRL